MKQPELGKKIVELRKAKGMTQEELVEKCNISVRTIQRIETGEVTPRSFTIKTIFSALDYELNDIFESQPAKMRSEIAWWQKILLTNVGSRDQGTLMRPLNLACLAGVMYFVLGFLESAVEYYRYRDEFIFGTGGYVILKIAVLVSYIFFQRGLIAVAGVFDNYLLKIISILLIGSNIIATGYDIASVFYFAEERVFVLSGISMCFGVMGIIYGIALRRLEKNVGRVAELAGIFEIIAGAFFLTVALFFLGFIALIPAELFEIILLFRVIESIRTSVHPVVKSETAPG